MARRRLAIGGVLLLVIAGGAAVLWRPASHVASPPPRQARTTDDRPAVPRLFAAPEDSTVPCAIQGSVRDREGRAIAGALVAVVRSSKDSDGAGALAVAVAAGNREGRYCVSVLAPGDYFVTAHAEGFLAPGPKRVSAPVVGTVDLMLGPGGQLLSGRVLDAGGGAIAGARVQIDVDREATRSGAVAVTLADNEGRYRLTLPRGLHGYYVQAEGYAADRGSLQVIGRQVWDFRLLPAARVSGRVIERGSRAPVAGAVVRMQLEGSRPAAGATISDESGAFVIDALAPGVYELFAHKGRLVGLRPSRLAVKLAEQVADVVIELEPGHSLSGTVRGPASAPISAEVVVTSTGARGAGQSLSATTDGKGAFRFDGLLPGAFVVVASAPGFLDAGRRVTVTSDVVGIELVLGAAAHLEAIVVDADGRPVPGAEVRVWTRGKGLRKPMRSSADGGFSFYLPAGVARVEAEHPEEGQAGSPDVTLVPGERKEVRLQLAGGRRGGHYIGGQVRWKDGAPAGGVAMIATGWEQSAGRAMTDGEGRYRVGPIPKGVTVVVGVELDMEGFDSLPQRATKMPDRDVEGFDFVAPRTEGRIHGVVLGPNGTPLGGAVVTTRPGRRGARTVTADDGTFQVDGLVDGTYSVVAQHPGYPLAAQPGVTPGPRPVRVRFEPGATLAGRVVRADGRQVGGYVLRVNRAGGAEGVTSAPDATGAFEVSGLLGGSYDLAVATTDGASGHLAVAVAAGQQRRDLRVVVGEGPRLTGRLVDWETNAPVTPASARAEALERQVSGAVDGQGRFHLDGLVASAPMAVSFEAVGYRPPPRRVTIAPGETVRDLGTIPLVRAARLDQGLEQEGRIGLVLESNDDGVVLVRAAPEGLPAAAAGLRAGDVIARIDGHEVRNLGLEPVASLLRGAPGTALTVDVRSRTGESRRVQIIRE